MELKFASNISENEMETLKGLIDDFVGTCVPNEEQLYLYKDGATKAIFTECHIMANQLIDLCTSDVPLDPEDQGEYKSNRDIVSGDGAFVQMKIDAKKGRAFSNIVTEYTKEFAPEKPIKIIGGQHRIEAIREALEAGVNQFQGIKVYFGLNIDQRLDAQIVSNTNIDVSPDLLDRMMETYSGSALRDWCHDVSLIDDNSDFGDKKSPNNAMTVREARTFVINYYMGREIHDFQNQKTDGMIAPSGGISLPWEEFKEKHPDWDKNEKLKEAGKNYARLIEKQVAYFSNSKSQAANMYKNKVHNYAVLAAWAFIAGLLEDNPVRLNRHYKLSETTGKDPLNAQVLASARHKSDPENYRGLGTRTDAKERGRLIELFYLQAESGGGIDARLVKLAMSKYVAKQANLEVREIEES